MFRIPTITKNLLIINFIAFLATVVLQMRGIDLAEIGGLHFFMAKDFHFFQLVTYLFLHANFMHILSNMFGLWMFGCVIENVWGPKKFLFYYIICGFGAGIVQELVQFADYTMQGLAAYQYVSVNGVQITTENYINLWTTIGASGAVYGILLAFGMLFPNERMFIIPIPIPIKAKWLIIGYFVIELVSAMSGPGDGIAHMAHLGGMIFGFLLIRYWRKHPGQNQAYGQDFFNHMKQTFNNRQQTKQRQWVDDPEPQRETDEEYNARMHKKQEEIDAILDKIRKSGYDSLSKEEKKKLFDQSRPS